MIKKILREFKISKTKRVYHKMPNNEMKYTITENVIYELSSRLDTAEKRIKYRKLDLNI